LPLEVKDRILEKAHDMFMRYGIRSVSMDDIAAQLGMSKKTLYQYFSDKDELVEGVITIKVNGMQTECTDCKKQSKDAVHEIFITMENIVEQLRNMNPMVLNDLEKFHFKAYQKFLEHKNKFLLKIIEDNIRRGIKEELYRAEVNIDILSKFRLGSMLIAFDQQIFPLGKYNLADVTKEILEHFVYGMASLKGHKLIQKYKQQFQKAL
jgi:AcrR family transcriptional regulator